MTDSASLAYEWLREQIVTSQLPGGTRLVEGDIAGRIGVSRTPLREAFTRLARDGLVTQEPGRGAAVTLITAEEATAVYQARDALESYLLRLVPESAASAFDAFAEEFGHLAKATPDTETVGRCGVRFDQAVRQTARSPVIASLLTQLDGRIQRLRHLAATDTARLRESCIQRQQVAAALARGNGTAAATANSERLRGSLDAAVRQLLPKLAPPTGADDNLPLV